MQALPLGKSGAGRTGEKQQSTAKRGKLGLGKVMKKIGILAVTAALLSTPALSGGYSEPKIEAPVIVAATKTSSANKDNVIVMLILAAVFAGVAR
ncbi:MAG: hypothetical protein ACJA06_001524 [Halocynthiibacter sp.]|jgi:hypothetical protein